MPPKSSSIWRRKPTARLRSRPGRRWAKITGRDHTHLADMREDEKIRFRDHSGAATQDHLVADLVRHRERARQLHRRLHQRERADPVAHANAVASSSIRTIAGSAISAKASRVYRPPIDTRTVSDMLGKRSNGEAGDRPQLHHAAPEMGHPFDLYRQSADADFVARRADRLDIGDGREARPASSTTTGSSSSTSTARSRHAPSSASASMKACA